MFKNPFSFEGRIRRTEFGLTHIISTVALVIMAFIAAAADAIWLYNLSLIPFLWFIWAQGAKRCHDLGNSGWYQLIPFYVLFLLFQDGEHGTNQYGENPKGIGNNQQNFYTNQNQHQSQYNNQQSGYQGGYSGGHNNNNISYGATENRFNQGGEYKEGDLYK